MRCIRVCDVLGGDAEPLWCWGGSYSLSIAVCVLLPVVGMPDMQTEPMPDAVANTVPIVKVGELQAPLRRRLPLLVMLDEKIGLYGLTEHRLTVQVEIGHFAFSSGPNALHAASLLCLDADRTLRPAPA